MSKPPTFETHGHVARKELSSAHWVIVLGIVAVFSLFLYKLAFPAKPADKVYSDPEIILDAAAKAKSRR